MKKTARSGGASIHATQEDAERAAMRLAAEYAVRAVVTHSTKGALVGIRKQLGKVYKSAACMAFKGVRKGAKRV